MLCFPFRGANAVPKVALRERRGLGGSCLSYPGPQPPSIETNVKGFSTVAPS